MKILKKGDFWSILVKIGQIWSGARLAPRSKMIFSIILVRGGTYGATPRDFRAREKSTFRGKRVPPRRKSRHRAVIPENFFPNRKRPPRTFDPCRFSESFGKSAKLFPKTLGESTGVEGITGSFPIWEKLFRDYRPATTF